MVLLSIIICIIMGNVVWLNVLIILLKSNIYLYVYGKNDVYKVCL